MTDEFTTVFPPYYDRASMSRGTAGWENPPYYLTAYGLAVKHGYTGTEEEWLASLKGDPGPGIVILGHYDTLEELEEDVTDPEDGEMYDVGSGAGQLVYYWSGDDWLPLNVHGPQGETGPAGQDGAPGVDGADGASAYEQAQEAGYAGTEAQFTQQLADLPGYTEQARLWAVAAGEAESAAEGYAEAAAESAAAAGAASSVSYDNSDSGLTATNVQDAIDEVAQGGGGAVAAEDVSYNGSVGSVVVTNVKDALDNLPTGSDSTPAANYGPGYAGTSGYWSRADHIHPVDNSRVPNTRKINYSALDNDIALFWGSTITFSLSWSGSGPYTQAVSVDVALSWTSGITSKSRISLQPTAAQLAQLISDGVVALTVENNAGVLTAYSIGAAPTTAMTIACTITEVET